MNRRLITVNNLENRMDTQAQKSSVFIFDYLPLNLVRFALTVFLLLSGVVVSIEAQHKHSGGGASQNEYPSTAVNASTLPPPPLMTGIGISNIKITTKSELAQKYFNQGVNLLHCFWDVEAYRAFREAARQDESAAMAYWGIYTALAQNSQEMAEERSAALKKAVELMPTVSDQEKYYIRAISLQAEPGKGRPAWISEMEALIDKYPEDVEAKLFLANSLSSAASSYAPDGRPRDGKLYGQAILRNLLITHPNHPAVHHYWIHAVENSSRPQDALASAAKLPSMVPNSGHMIHMAGHIYYRLGDYEKGRKYFVDSMRVDLEYMKSQNMHPINNWNFVHNLDYLVANCAEEGRYEEAARYAKMLEEIPSDDSRLKSTGLGYMLYGGYTALTRLHMRYGFWEEAIQSNSIENPKTLAEKYQSGVLSYLKGMNAIEKGKAAEAAGDVAALEAVIKELSEQRVQQASDWYFNYASRILPVHLQDLKGSLLSLEGKNEEAFKLLAEATEKEKNLGYWEPPHYSRPVLESLGEAYVRAGKFEEALRAFEQELKLRPNSGFAFLGMARTFVKSGNKSKAAEHYRQFLNAWKNADKNLPQIQEATVWLKNNG